MTTHLDTLFENALCSKKKEKLLQINSINEIVIEIEFIICIDLLLLETGMNVVMYGLWKSICVQKENRVKQKKFNNTFMDS